MKKKIGYMMLLLCSLFLCACAEKSPWSLEEMISENENNLAFWKEELSAIFLAHTGENVRDITVYFSSLEENSFHWKGTLKSVVYFTGEDFKISFDLSLDYQDEFRKQPLRLSLTGDFLSYQDKHYINIQDFSLFMGTGNINASVINTMISEAQGQWIRLELDEQENLVKTLMDRIDKQGEMMFSLSGRNLDQVLDEQVVEWAIFQFQEESILWWELFNALFLPLCNLFLDEQSTFLQVNSHGEHTLSYEKARGMVQKYRLQSDFYSFLGELFLSSKNIGIVISDLIDKETYQTKDEIIQMQIQNKGTHTKDFSLERKLHGEKSFYVDVSLNTKKENKYTFQGELFDKNEKIAKDLFLQVFFEGEVKFGTSEFTLHEPENVSSLENLFPTIES